jgi:hypothetical protein
MKRNLSLANGKLVVKEGWGKEVELALDDLRLLYMVSYFDFRFQFLTNTSKQSVSVMDLDSLSAEKQDSAFQTLRQMMEAGKNFALKNVFLCMASYGRESILFTLLDLKRSGVDIFTPLMAGSAVRQEKLKKWLAGDPHVVLSGGGSTAVVNKAGFKVGSKFLPWSETATIKIQINETAFFKVASLLVVPNGVSTGSFGMKQYKYSLRNIKRNRLELYYAECTFWRLQADKKTQETGLTERLTALKDMRDQGVLTEEKYQKAKSQILSELS